MTEHKPEEIEALANENDYAAQNDCKNAFEAEFFRRNAAALRAYAELLREREAEDRLVKDGWCWQHIDYDDWGPRYCWIQVRATVHEISNPDRSEATRLALAQMEANHD